MNHFHIKICDKTRVCPYLLDLEPTDITGPLTQFQAAKANKEATEKLKPGDIGLWNPKEDPEFNKIIGKRTNEVKSIQELLVIPSKVSPVDKNTLEYRRKQSLFNQAVDEGKQ